jgi:hypothetical protein
MSQPHPLTSQTSQQSKVWGGEVSAPVSQLFNEGTRIQAAFLCVQEYPILVRSPVHKNTCLYANTGREKIKRSHSKAESFPTDLEIQTRSTKILHSCRQILFFMMIFIPSLILSVSTIQSLNFSWEFPNTP